MFFIRHIHRCICRKVKVDDMRQNRSIEASCSELRCHHKAEPPRFQTSHHLTHEPFNTLFVDKELARTTPRCGQLWMNRRAVVPL